MSIDESRLTVVRREWGLARNADDFQRSAWAQLHAEWLMTQVRSLIGADVRTVTVDVAAQMLGVGRQTVYNLAREGKLPGARRLGKRIVVSRKVLEAFLDVRLDEA